MKLYQILISLLLGINLLSCNNTTKKTPFSLFRKNKEQPNKSSDSTKNKIPGPPKVAWQERHLCKPPPPAESNNIIPPQQKTKGILNPKSSKLPNRNNLADQEWMETNKELNFLEMNAAVKKKTPTSE